VNVYPILLDSRPPYASGEAYGSLLALPVGEGTLLDHFRARLQAVTPHPAVVFTALEAAAGPAAPPPELHGVEVVRAAERAGRLDACEPSDWLLVVDPTCVAADGFDPEPLLREPVDTRWVRHLVALDRNADGTRECVEFGSGQRVRRIRRFYDRVTWPFTAGVSCSLLPAASAMLSEHLPWTTLGEMRHVLSRRGVPSRDIPIDAEVLNLAVEPEMLAFNEHFIARAAARRPARASNVVFVGSGHQVARSARLVGPLVVQAGASVEDGATVLGPALLGREARVGAGALVAQSVLAAGAVVAPQATVRHRVLAGEASAARGAPAIVPRGHDRRDHERRSRAERRRGWEYSTWKPIVEASLAGLALVLLAPLLALVALLVKLDSRGPAFFGHVREGKDGRLFPCWKFRTMYVGADARERELRARSLVDGPQFKLQRDPRITRIGRWLRASNLDELPQLVNVALGQMSLVGPRPSPFQENQLCVPWREGRLSVRPGITGLWQVCRHERSAGDFHQWIQYDLLYVRHSSFSVDMKILLATVLTGGGKSHVPLSWILSSRSLEEESLLEGALHVPEQGATRAGRAS
jgi:lipopolysaccharide/colanic/teichoic acid biosynthesis glycosyltransferase